MKSPATVHDMFAKSKQQWLTDARNTAEMLLKDRHSITIEDVLKECPFPSYLHHNTIGRVFIDKRFCSVGITPSRRSSMNGRFIRRWALSDAYLISLEIDCA